MARHSLVPQGFGSFEPILALHREMNRLFDDAFRGAGSEAGSDQQRTAMPSMLAVAMNVSETESEYRVCVELPGVTENDIDLTVNDDVLIIRGEKKFESREGSEKENFHYIERAYGSFQRSLRLPFSTNPDEVNAAFQNGVLTVTIPKSAQQQRSRRIAIQGSSPRSQEQRRAGEQSLGEEPSEGPSKH